MSENSVSGSNLRPPKYNGNGGRAFVVFVLHFKAWLNTQGCGGVLDADFDIALPSSESERATLLVALSGSDAAAKADAKTKLIALDMNAKATYGLILALQTEDMLNKVTLQQSADPNWPTGKFPEIWKEICDEENPKDEMAEMDMEDELREIRLGKERNPKEILRDMGSIEAKYKLKISEEKKTLSS